VVVILDELHASDLLDYRAMLDGLPHREQICGFFSGKDELLNWESSDLFQFYYDTLPIRGSLNELLPLLDETAVDRAIQIGVCNIYHSCVHNMLHEQSGEILKGLYKSASFVVQAICFRETGHYISRQKLLRSAVSPEEQAVLDTFALLKNGDTIQFEEMSEQLFVWAKNQLRKHAFVS